MENLNQILLSGGNYHCTPEWNKEPFGKENCFKLYFPVEGSAELCFNDKWIRIDAGNAYYINGFMLDKYCCNDFMNVYWLHFIPESQYVNMYLSGLDPVFCWERGNVLLNSIQPERIPLLFDGSDMRENKLHEKIPMSLMCLIQSYILLLISDLVERQNSGFGAESYDLYVKLKPAIDFMNDNFHESLSLDEIASKTFLNPEYFLRLFKKCFKITPNRYLNMVRMNEASRLLIKTNKSIQDVAESTGYSNQFYFSKVFKTHFHKTPFEYRNTKLSP